MNIIKNITQIESQLEQIQLREKANQRKQAKTSQRILELEAELQQQQQHRDRLDEEALELYTQVEKLKPKLDKLKRIANLSQEFLELHTECLGSEDLLSTLYSSVSAESVKDNIQALSKSPLLKPLAKTQPKTQSNDYSQYSIGIDEIRKALPNAEKIYQRLLGRHLEEYKTYQNFVVDGLDLLWYAVAFIAFGRSAYRKMGFKYHPDLDGSQRAMQLINTAWSISQEFLNDSNTAGNGAVNSM